MPKQRTKDPRKAVGGELKHRLILGAARKVFEADGLDGASAPALMRRFVDNTITALEDRHKRGSRES